MLNLFFACEAHSPLYPLANASFPTPAQAQAQTDELNKGEETVSTGSQTPQRSSFNGSGSVHSSAESSRNTSRPNSGSPRSSSSGVLPYEEGQISDDEDLGAPTVTETCPPSPFKQGQNSHQETTPPRVTPKAQTKRPPLVGENGMSLSHPNNSERSLPKPSSLDRLMSDSSESGQYLKAVFGMVSLL